jgi:hypothetical protein
MMQRLAVLAAGPLACGLFAAACGSSGSGGAPVASLSSSPSGSATSSGGSGGGSMLAYARCMRSHGLPSFPDPNANGNLQLNGEPGSDLDPNSARFKAADAACKSLRPAPQAPPKGLRAQMLKYARCMRAHGISDFPDPNPDGSLQIKPSGPGSDLDPNNPQYKAAHDACKKYQPGGGQGGTLGSTGGAS